MSLRMSWSEREEFLAGVHVGVLSVASVEGSGPLTVPVWYGYRPGGTVNVSTARDRSKARAIGAAGRFSLCAQDEWPPYKYVSVEGQAERLALARRYVGPKGDDAFIATNPGGADIVIRMTPERWLTADYRKAGR